MNGGKSMLEKVEVYYFSPTGGTKKVAEEFAEKISKDIRMINLASSDKIQRYTDSELTVIAAPVFGGRIPAIVSEKIKNLHGISKKAVSLVVYGNRAYEDALLELNNALEDADFEIVASGAFVAQHSIVPEVAHGRPDDKDLAEIRDFAEKVMRIVEKETVNRFKVPGNFPYKQPMSVPATPISLESCNHCRNCVKACPVDAITIQDTVVTDPSKCILCMACTSACHKKARVLPQPLNEKMRQMLDAFKNVRNKNEMFM